MDYRLTRSRRKTVAIVIDRDGTVEVRAPLRLSVPSIERFVEEKQRWIAEKQALALERVRLRGEFRLEIGSRVPLLGKDYPVLPGKRVGFSGDAFLINPDKEAGIQLVGLYRELAREHLTKRTAFFAEQMGVQPASLRITGASTRFGSCSGSNGISFTWKLLLAEPDLIDYVVVHELCHIRQHNHSRYFWEEVGRVLPDFREREIRLKAFGRQLLEQDWQ